MRKGEVIKGSKRALVTGASTGIGRQYAEQLAALGYNLIVVGLKEQMLEELAVELRNEHNIEVVSLVKDLATMSAAEELFAWSENEGLKA